MTEAAHTNYLPVLTIRSGVSSCTILHMYTTHMAEFLNKLEALLLSSVASGLC